MDIAVTFFLYVLGTLLSIKAFNYGIYEWKQQNKIAAFMVILLTLISYILFLVLM